VERGPNCDCTFNSERLCDDCQDLLFLNIQEGVYSFPESEWADISDSAKDLVSNLLVRDPRSRLATDQILEHPWIVDVESQMMPVLCRSQTMPVMCHRNDSGPSSSPLQFDMSPVNSLPSNYYGSNSDLEDSSPVQSSFNKKISSNCRSVTTTLSETIFHLDLSDEGVGSWKDTEEHKKATWAGLRYPIESGLAKRRALKLQRLSTGSNDSGNISSSSPPSRPQLLQTDK
jgi:serine/threonine protein kinase